MKILNFLLFALLMATAALLFFPQAADRLGIPVVTLIDTPGAFPGASAEERGQGGAISRSMQMMWRLDVPTIAVVIGEGSSGGALGLGVADRVLMLENSTYSVISPEGASAILWRDAKRKADAAAALPALLESVSSEYPVPAFSIRLPL